MIDPTSARAEKFHLFIEPTGTLAEELSAIITQLAHEYGGPVFKPHITLLGGIPGNISEIIARSQAMADLLAPFTLTLGKLDTRDMFFRALFMHLREKEQMKKYHAQALEIFLAEDEEIYMPHLSLLYGNYPRSQKEETMTHLKTPQGSFFIVDILHLYRTEGEVENWQKIKDFKLTLQTDAKPKTF